MPDFQAIRPALDPETNSRLEELAADHSSGAAELVEEGARVLENVRLQTPLSTVQTVRALWVAGHRLMQAQPAMAGFVFLVNKVLLSAQAQPDGQSAIEAARVAAANVAQLVVSNRQSAAKAAAGLLPPRATLVTHSYSSSVLRALEAAKEQGNKLRVICTEARPMCEGLNAARRISEIGHEVTVVVDASGPQMLRRAHCLLVGADAVLPGAWVNKVGTVALALAAQHSSRAVYAIVSTDKFLPEAAAAHLRFRPSDPTQVWSDPPSGVEVLNYYFERIPISYATAVVTEHGPLTPTRVHEMLAETVVHPLLAGVQGPPADDCRQP